MNIAIAKPYVGPEEEAAVLEVLRSGGLAQGKRVAQFEERFAALHGARHGVAVNNGTTSLIAALMAHGIGPGDEVIVPPFTFFATASSVFSVGARPVFADIEPDTFNLSVEAAEAAITPRTRAIMPVHLYGQPADMPAFQSLCERKGLVLLEDAAQAHDAAIGARKVGTWGTASFSFYPTKNMTTTEGGMILTNDDEIARQLRMIRNQGMNTQYLHEVIGYNFRMTDLAAAIGLVQLDRLGAWTEARRANAAFYNGSLEGVTIPVVRDGYRHVYHQYTLRAVNRSQRDALVKSLNTSGIGARVYYPIPLHKQPAVLAVGGYDGLTFPQAERACDEVFSIPIHPLLTDDEKSFVVKETNAAC